MNVYLLGKKVLFFLFPKRNFLFLVSFLALQSARSQWLTSGTSIYNSNSGFVGVGTSSPATYLHVISNLAASSDASLSGFVQLWGDNAVIWKAGNQQGGLRFGSATNLGAASWSEKMRILDNGNVGIGTTAPQSMLDVRGTVSAPGMALVNAGTGVNDNFITSTFGSNTFHLIGTYSGWDANGVFVAGYNSASTGSSQIAAQRVYIGSPFSGTNNYLCVNFVTNNVGIGTSNPGSNKLAVEGTIGARKVVVTATTPFPDYVFNPGYTLPSLGSVQRYIEANHHLPDIPSADSVARAGLDLGGNQAALLKKIEELTLYVIQQNEKMEAMSRELQAQGQQLEAQRRTIERLNVDGGGRRSN